MAYPNANDIENIQLYTEDILSRKEFYSLKERSEYNDKESNVVLDYLDKQIQKLTMQPMSYQLFIRNMMNPDINTSRLMLKYSPGLGKTLTALLAASKFIDYYKIEYKNSVLRLPIGKKITSELISTPTVFVLGFGGTSVAVIRDLLKYPELGYITRDELKQFNEIKILAQQGLTEDIKKYKELTLKYKKRITSKKHGGFFKFYGYREFVNKLFSSDVDLISLESSLIGSGKILEDVINEYIRDGKIKVDRKLLDSFKKSFLICDESHHLYNSYMKNNYGVAVQYVLDSVPSLRAMFLTATPINNSPSEIIDVISLLTGKKIPKNNLFKGKELLPGALTKIGDVLSGRISFLQDNNTLYYPTYKFVGNTVPSPVKSKFTDMPYLKFQVCELTKLHLQTYLEMLNENLSDIAPNGAVALTGKSGEELNLALMNEYTDNYQPSVPLIASMIFDMIIPNPRGKLGLYKSTDIKIKLLEATEKERKEYGIEIGEDVITGNFLVLKNLKKYSGKYSHMMENILSSMDKPQKLMIFHDKVRSSGVMMIAEILKHNGFIDHGSEPTDFTLCSKCGKIKNQHIYTKEEKSRGNNCSYYPARFILIHSNIDSVKIEKLISQYNTPDNSEGLNYKIIIGSMVIKESYEIKDVQQLHILSIPVNMSNMLQVIGRTVRKNSHEHLPHDKWNVDIFCYLHVINPNDLQGVKTELLSTSEKKFNNEHFAEEYRYLEKLTDYITIQHIDRVMNANAIDANVHRALIMTPSVLKQYFPDGDIKSKPHDIFGNLYFEPQIKIPEYDLRDLNLSTFNAYGYGNEEVYMIQYIIKRLFYSQSVFIYDDLWEKVKNPPFRIEYNPEFFSENNFIIAINNLIIDDSSIRRIDSEKSEIEKEYLTIKSLFNFNERKINIDGFEYKIKHIGNYFIRFPVINNYVVEDIESFDRIVTTTNNISIPLSSFSNNINYEIKRRQIMETDLKLLFINETDDFYFKLLEEVIEYFVEKDAGKAKISPLEDKYNKILDIYDSFAGIIYVKDVLRYKDVGHKMSRFIKEEPDHKLSSILDKKTPIGYLSKNIRIYDGSWFEVNRVTMNRLYSFNENSALVGYMEIVGGKIKFKIRSPIQSIRAANKSLNIDYRNIERGSVCETKSKGELIKLYTMIKPKGEMPEKIKTICEAIRDRLIVLEQLERDKESNIKFFYMLHEDKPNI